MSFNTLEARFNATADILYTRYKNPEQLATILPNSAQSRSRIKDDSRGLPVVSTGRDLKLMGNFLKSSEKGGPLFLAKQLLLQTGNTFAETRLYNPLGVLIHAVPFIHRPRNVGKVPNLLSSIQIDRGALQAETINKFSEGKTSFGGRLLSGVTNAVSAPFRALSTTPEKTPDGNFYLRPEDKEFYTEANDIRGPVPKLASRESLGARGKKKLVSFINSNKLTPLDLGYYGRWDVNRKKQWVGSSNKFVSNVLPQFEQVKGNYVLRTPRRNPTNDDTSRGANNYTYVEKTIQGQKDSKGNTLNSIFNLNNTGGPAQFLSADRLEVNAPAYSDTTFDRRLDRYNTQPSPYTSSTFLESAQKLYPYFVGQNSYTLGDADVDNSGRISTNRGTTSNIYDPYNATQLITTRIDPTREVSYEKISGKKEIKSDIIQFVFNSIDENEPIHFRALISNIKQNVKPEYNETRYVGRTERFVTYAGAKRSVTMEFNVVALSQVELGNMWTRINYLTGLAFPRGVSTSGFMKPPLFKLTVGGIFDNQPCYVESLDFTLLDDSTTFDIDSEVSQVIAVNMSITVLEKRSAFYNSPFYEISKKIAESDETNRSRFSRLPNELAPSRRIPSTVERFANIETDVRTLPSNTVAKNQVSYTQDELRRLQIYARGGFDVPPPVTSLPNNPSSTGVFLPNRVSPPLPPNSISLPNPFRRPPEPFIGPPAP